MSQKVIKIGTSAGVTLSKKALKELGLKPGDNVEVNFNRKNKVITIHSATEISKEDEKIAKLTMNFIDRYRGALNELADK
ncbi:MAG: hypothetical protein WDZ40_04200 [Candidatus Spechtbacterales bacterium]